MAEDISPKTEESSFVHLHVHTEYSFLDSIIRIDRLVERTKAFGMSAVAVTDHGNMFCGFEFFTAAKKAGIQAILGSEVYLASGSRQEKSRESRTTHLTVLVKNETGYRNLCRMLSLAYEDGFYYRPRIDWELLERYGAGLIVFSGCYGGAIALSLREGKREEAATAIQKFKNLFGDDFYIEIQRNGVENQEVINRELIALSEEYDVPLVATNDCHYLEADEREAHDVFLCIGMQKTIRDDDRMRFPSAEFYLKSPAEMAELFADLPEAISNTVKIAKKCRFKFDTDGYKIPRFVPPEGKALEEYLTSRAQVGLSERLEQVKIRHPNWTNQKLTETKAAYETRFSYELEIIKKMKFSGYFLIVADFINWAKDQDIPVGPGRGSGAGSLVAYCLKITDIDPMEYNLLFERFLNVERISMPDFDVDFCIENRDRVIRYVSGKYNTEAGRHQVAQIITYGKMKARAVIRDVGRVLGMPYSDVDSIAKLVPNQLNITLQEAFEKEPRFNEIVSRDDKVKQLLAICERLEGLTRHASIHAAGVVIADRPLDDYVPLYRGTENEVITQFDMKSIEKLGLLKFDFLGLRNLTVIKRAVENINKTTGSEFDISKIRYDDKQIFELLGRGDTLGIFQFESSGMRDVIRRLKPQAFEDIIAVGALYRPGPIEGGMIDDFIKRRHGKTAVVYEVPQLEAILKETYGVIVYQEQVMKIASVLANYSLGEADLLRRAMGKKIAEEMANHEKRFIEGAQKNAIPKLLAQRIFHLMSEFAKYGFNKSHAAAYGMISYQTAYLKAHFPKEFMAALMTSEMEDTEKMILYIQDCQERGIQVLPPDLNESDLNFTVVGDKIRFGLGAIKNVGVAAVEEMLADRKKGGAYESIFEFAKRIDLRKINKRVVEALIRAGVFDFSGFKRSQMYAVLDQLMEFSRKAFEERKSGQRSLFQGVQKKGHSRSVPMEIRIPSDLEEWPERVRLNDEKTLVGFYVSGHPLRHYQMISRLVADHRIEGLDSEKEGASIRVVAVPVKVKEIITKKGGRMAFMTVEDLTGACEVVVFSDLYKEAQGKIAEVEPLLIAGTVARDEEGGAKIIAKEVTLMREAVEAGGRSLHLEVSVESDQGALKLAKLYQLCKIHVGDTAIKLHLLDSERHELVQAAGNQIRISLSEVFLKECSDLFGDKALRLA